MSMWLWTSSTVFVIVAVSAWFYFVVALKLFVIFKAHFIDTDNFLPTESETLPWLEIVITKGAWLLEISTPTSCIF